MNLKPQAMQLLITPEWINCQNPASYIKSPFHATIVPGKNHLTNSWHNYVFLLWKQITNQWENLAYFNKNKNQS